MYEKLRAEIVSLLGRGYRRWDGGSKTLHERTRTMSDCVYQVWTCRDCGTARVWGSTVCPDPNNVPFLICNKCRGVTAHIFHGHDTLPAQELFADGLS